MSGQDQAAWFRSTLSAIEAEVRKAVIGQDEMVRGVLIGIASGGHVLLEGMPGLGKTLMVRSIAEALHLQFGRVQFTPDLMPADITGANVLVQSDTGERRFEFRQGPVFCNILLADEINRATPKTQSALLEAMQERAVTAGGKRHTLQEPFLVLATQNPVEQEGTYPLPEAQLDRFMLKLLVPYPSREELARIVNATTGAAHAQPSAVASGEDVMRLREIAREVPVSTEVMDFAMGLVLATHPGGPEGTANAKKFLRFGSSPRGGQALIATGKVMALLDGRFNVSKEDIIAAMRPCLRHRVAINFEAEAEGLTADDVLADILNSVQRGDRDPIPV